MSDFQISPLGGSITAPTPYTNLTRAPGLANMQYGTQMPAGGGGLPMSTGDMLALASLAQALGLVGNQQPTQGPPTVIPARIPDKPNTFSVPRLPTGSPSPFAASLFGA